MNGEERKAKKRARKKVVDDIERDCLECARKCLKLDEKVGWAPMDPFWWFAYNYNSGRVKNLMVIALCRISFIFALSLLMEPRLRKFQSSMSS